MGCIMLSCAEKATNNQILQMKSLRLKKLSKLIPYLIFDSERLNVLTDNGQTIYKNSISDLLIQPVATSPELPLSAVNVDQQRFALIFYSKSFVSVAFILISMRYI